MLQFKIIRQGIIMTIKIYTANNCPYCIRAKNLLERKGIDFELIDLSGHPDAILELKNKTQWRTIPQIFINDKLIGGYTELAELENSGELDLLMNSVTSIKD
jgi:glutaredoxin 3